MKQQWEKFVVKIDGLSLRERGMIFAAIVFVLFASAKVLFLDTFLVQQKKLTSRITQQKEQMNVLQTKIAASLQARKGLQDSAQHRHLEQIKQELEEGNAFLQSRRDRLVAPEEMAGLLQQVLKRDGTLQLINLRTLPVAPLVAESSSKPQSAAGKRAVADKDAASLDEQIFRHGVEITVQGSYLDLLQYLTEIEGLPKQVFWGQVRMKVLRYPVVELSLTVYTLSLEKTWMQI